MPKRKFVFIDTKVEVLEILFKQTFQYRIVYCSSPELLPTELYIISSLSHPSIYLSSLTAAGALTSQHVAASDTETLNFLRQMLGSACGVVWSHEALGVVLSPSL